MSVYANRFGHHAAILLVSLGVAVPAYGFAVGTGEPNDPYQIATEEHLLSIGSDPSLLDKYFVLVGNIDLNPLLPYRRALIAPDKHDAAGFQGKSFTGRFDGQNHSIRGMNIATGTGHFLGLFGRIGQGGRVFNLRLQGAAIAGGAGAHCLGALAGFAEGCTIAQCSAAGRVGAGGDARAIGGLVGFLWCGGRIMQCSSSCTVSSGADSMSLGGLVGDNGGDVVNCFANGNVSGTDCQRVGGLVGLNGAGVYRPPFLNATGYIVHCYATGSVSGGSSGTDIGGLVGADYYSYTIGSFWDIWKSGTSASAGGKGLTTTRMYDRNVYLAARWDLTGERDNGTADVWQAGGGYPRLTAGPPVPLAGSGTPKDPYRITNAEELGAANYYAKLACFKLDDNVDLADITWTEAPLCAFDDRFDGAGYVISNLTVRGYRHVGLFDVLGVNARVKDMTLENVDIDGENGSEYVAALAGGNRGYIVNCSVVGDVGGDDGVAGLVGCNCKSGTIARSWAAGAVTAVGGRFYHAGGLVASNQGSIVDSHTYMQVSGYPHTLGGLVGSNRGDICGCCADGQVTGQRCLGGLAGANAGTICGSYATVDVSSTSMAPHAGGLVGANAGKIRNCYAVGAILNESGAFLGVGGLVGPTPVGDEGGLVVNCF